MSATARLYDLLGAALDRPTGTCRRAFVDTVARRRPGLGRRLRALLAADADTGPLDAPTTSPVSAEDDAGRRLGPYRLLRRLGEGGMGTVYLARRDDRQFRRRVAIKRVRRELLAAGGADALEAEARFRAERQILAELEHPGIARLYDGGTDGDGRPYLVMELVDGEPITAFCRRRGLGVEALLRLVLRLTEAVAFAHRRGLVHRDLKPSNVLVTADGEPRLLDFGIAKVLGRPGHAPDDDAPSPTPEAGRRPLTPGLRQPGAARRRARRPGERRLLAGRAAARAARRSVRRTATRATSTAPARDPAGERSRHRPEPPARRRR